jgi:hypothetical protein
MKTPVMKPCPCGFPVGPRPVTERKARKLPLVRVRCRGCGLTSTAARLSRVSIAWNMAVETERERRADLAETDDERYGDRIDTSARNEGA